VVAELRGREDVGLVLDGARAQEHAPVILAGLERERRRDPRGGGRRARRARDRAPESAGRSRSRGRASPKACRRRRAHRPPRWSPTRETVFLPARRRRTGESSCRSPRPSRRRAARRRCCGGASARPRARETPEEEPGPGLAREGLHGGQDGTGHGRLAAGTRVGQRLGEGEAVVAIRPEVGEVLGQADERRAGAGRRARQRGARRQVRRDDPPSTSAGALATLRALMGGCSVA